jgi:hypothetical protein
VPEAFEISDELKVKGCISGFQDALPQICKIASAGFEGLTSIAISDVQSWTFHSAEKDYHSRSNEHPTQIPYILNTRPVSRQSLPSITY